MTRPGGLGPARRLGASALAVVLAVGLAVGAALSAPQPLLVGLVGLAGAASLAAGTLWRRQVAVLSGVALLGSAFVVATLVGPGGPGAAAALGYGLGCFLVAELGCAACEAAAGAPSGGTARLDGARALHLVLVGAVSLAVGVLAILADRHPTGGSLLELGGLVVASTLVGVVAALARRRGAAGGA